jgi:hypothetical protein
VGLVFITAGLFSAGLLASAETVIESFSQGGVIRWQVSGPPATCDVEWASSPAGPWQKSWDGLKGIVVTGTSAQASVPMFFRVARTDAWMQEGLVLHLPCNGDLLDHSAYGNNPTVIGFADLSADRAGNPSSALRLDSGEYLSLPGNSTLVMTNVTVALWTKFSAMTWMGLVEMGPSASVWSLFVDQSGGIPPNLPWHFYARGGADNPFVNTAPVLQSNQWYHIAATFSGTQAILYQDGVPAKTGTAAAVSTSITTLFVGRNASSTVPAYFSGSMDDIRVYSRALSAAEVAQIYSLAP